MMARPGNSGETANQPRRQSLLYRATEPGSDESTNPKDLELDEFLERIRDDPNDMFEALFNGTQELRDELEALSTENKTLKDRVKDKDVALRALIDERDRYKDAFAQQSLRLQEG